MNVGQTDSRQACERTATRTRFLPAVNGGISSLRTDVVGWIIFGLLAILLLPLLPVIALIWLFDRLVNR